MGVLLERHKDNALALVCVLLSAFWVCVAVGMIVVYSHFLHHVPVHSPPASVNYSLYHANHPPNSLEFQERRRQHAQRTDNVFRYSSSSSSRGGGGGGGNDVIYYHIQRNTGSLVGSWLIIVNALLYQDSVRER